jgi:CrcB protein
MGRPSDEAETGRRRDAPNVFAEMMTVGLGGAIGATLRGLVDGLASSTASIALPTAPMATLVVNLLGAFLLGAVLGRFERLGASPLARPFLVVGLLGSFTTYSTLVAQGFEIRLSAGAGAAVTLLAVSLLLGLAGFAAGERLFGGTPDAGLK